jgi:ornithine carbamoyltransferase
MHFMQTLNVNTSAAIPLQNARSRRRALAPSVKPFRLSTTHLLTGEEASVAELSQLLLLARQLKTERAKGISHAWLPGKQLALLFEKPSLRTRVSFTIAINELGGMPIEIVSSNTKHEEPEDTARVLAGYCHAVMARTMSHRTLAQMAAATSMPIINGLSDLHHPCQILADLMTLQEAYSDLRGLKICYIGDGNNILHSLLLLAPVLGVSVHYACPQGYAPNPAILQRAQDRAEGTGSVIKAFENPVGAVCGTHAVYTDVWTSMGFEKEAADRQKAFQGFQVNEALMSHALPGAKVMHCLPMVRGGEISKTLPDSPHSVIFQQSENRLHVQKALLVSLMA